MAQETCSVVNQFCDSPANLRPIVRVRAECFACGRPVCRQCSSLRKYLSYGRKRLCDDCQEEIDGNDHAVMRRLYAKAGVPYNRAREAT